MPQRLEWPALLRRLKQRPEVSQAVGSMTNESLTSEQLAQRVAAALHADPYFPDEHVTVSIEKG